MYPFKFSSHLQEKTDYENAPLTAEKSFNHYAEYTNDKTKENEKGGFKLYKKDCNFTGGEKEIKIYSCRICNVLFMDSELYRIHNICHSSEKSKFKCFTCGKNQNDVRDFYTHKILCMYSDN